MLGYQYTIPLTKPNCNAALKGRKKNIQESGISTQQSATIGRWMNQDTKAKETAMAWFKKLHAKVKKRELGKSTYPFGLLFQPLSGQLELIMPFNLQFREKDELTKGQEGITNSADDCVTIVPKAVSASFGCTDYENWTELNFVTLQPMWTDSGLPSCGRKL